MQPQSQPGAGGRWAQAGLQGWAALRAGCRPGDRHWRCTDDGGGPSLPCQLYVSWKPPRHRTEPPRHWERPPHIHPTSPRRRPPSSPPPIVVGPGIHQQQVSIPHLPVVGGARVPVVQDGCTQTAKQGGRSLWRAAREAGWTGAAGGGEGCRRGASAAPDPAMPQSVAPLARQHRARCNQQARSQPVKSLPSRAISACVGPAGKDGRVVRQAAAAPRIQAVQVEALGLELPHARLHGLRAGSGF